MAVIPAASTYEELLTVYSQVGRLLPGNRTGRRRERRSSRRWIPGWKRCPPAFPQKNRRQYCTRWTEPVVWRPGIPSWAPSWSGGIAQRRGCGNRLAASGGADAAYLFCPSDRLETVRALPAFQGLSRCSGGARDWCIRRMDRAPGTAAGRRNGGHGGCAVSAGSTGGNERDRGGLDRLFSAAAGSVTRPI